MDRGELGAAVARALYDDRVWDDTREVPWDEADDFQHTFFLEQAAVAIRVVLAEATRSIEALAEKDGGVDYALPEVLAVLARLVPQPPV